MANDQPTYNDLKKRIAELEAIVGLQQEDACHYAGSILNTIVEPMALVDTDYRHLYANQAYCNYFEVKREQLIGRSLADVIIEDVFEKKLRLQLDCCLKNGEQPCESIVSFKHTTGKRHLLMNVHCHQNSQGEVEGLVLTFKNITDLQNKAKEAEKAAISLLKAEEIAQIGHWEFDLDSRVVKASTGARTIYGLGIDGQELTIEETQAIPLPEYRKMLDDALSDLINKGIFYDVEYEIARPIDQEVRYIHSVAEYIGEQHVVFGVIRDVTDSRKTLRLIKEQNEEYLTLNEEYVTTIEELKKAKVSIEVSEEKFRTIFNMALGLMCIADINTATFLVVNPAFKRMLGYDAEELLSKSFLEFIHPDDVEATLSVVEKELQAGTAVLHFVNRYRCKDGSYVWLDWTSHPIPEKGVTYAIAHNITEMLEAQRALKERQELYELITGMMSDFIYSGYVDPDGRQTTEWVVGALKQITGYSFEEIKDMPGGFLSLILTEDLVRFDEETHDQIQALQPSVVEYRIRAKGGRIVWLRDHIYPSKDNNDPAKIRLVGATKDVTERRKTRQAMIESEERYRQLTNHLPDTVLLHDKGIITFINPAGLKLLGAEKEAQLIGRQISDFVPPDHKSIITERYKELEKYGHTKRMEQKLLRLDGQAVEVEIGSTVVRISNKDLVMVLIHDITSRKVSQQKIKALSQLNSTIVSNYPNGVVFLFDENYRYKHVDGLALSKINLKQEGFVGKRVQDVFSDIAPIIMPHLERLFEGETCYYEVELAGYIFANWGVPVRKTDGSKIEEAIVYAVDISELKHHEQLIRESKDRFSALVNHLQSGVFYIDTQGNILEVNPAMLRILDSPSEEETKKINILNFSPLVKIGYADKLKACIAQGEIMQGEAEYESIWGKHSIVNYYLVPIKEGDEVVGVLSSNEDVTDKRKAEEQLVFQSHLLDSINDFITATDMEGNITYTNQKVKDNFALAKETTAKRRVDIYGEDPQEGATQQEIVDETRKHGRWRGEVINISDSGERIHLDCRTQLLKDKYGKPTGMLGISSNITQRKAYEKELETKNKALKLQNEEYLSINEELDESLERIKELYDQTDLQNKKITHLLDGAKAVLEFDDFETTARKLFDSCKYLTGAQSGYVALLSDDGEENELLFLDAGGLPCTVDESLPMPIRGLRSDAYYLQKAVCDNDFMNSEHVDFMPEGHVALKNVIFAPLAINKKAVGLIGLANKPSDFDQEDLDTISAFAELASISLRNSLNIRELIKAKEKAEESDRLKTTFLNNISHEFRTPMNGILGFAEMLIKPNKTQERQQFYLRQLHESCECLLDIVTDTVEISQVQSENLPVKKKAFNLKTIINQLLDPIRAKVYDKGLDFQFQIDCCDEDLNLETDEYKIRRIIKHLLDNAVKFTHSGSVVLECQKNDLNELLIHVKDTGIGIAPDMQQKIFEPFRQVEIGMTRSYGGNGIGLSLVKSYVELLGGRIELQSVVNQGTRITLVLPLKLVKHKEVAPDKSASQPCHWPDKVILIVEDENINYTYIKELLLDTQATLFHVRNGQQAIDACRENAVIDLVLMDIKMPVMDGYEAARLIKAFRPEIPIIAQTAYALEKDIERIQTGHFDDYISKPIRQEKLLSLIENYF